MLTLAHRAMLGAASRPKPAAQLITLAGAGTSTESAVAIAVDSSGNRYVAGDTGSPTAGFVAKFDKDGSLLWQRKLTLGVSVNVGAAAINAAGDIFVCCSGRASGSISSGYVCKYSTAGVLQWQRKLTTTVSTWLYSIALDTSGDVYAVGQVSSTKSTSLLAKYSSGGTLQWKNIVSHATDAIDGSGGLSIDAAGNLYYSATHTITSPGNTWGMIVKCSGAGAFLSAHALRTDSYINDSGVTAVDGSGNFYVCGSSRSSFTNQPYVCKFNSSGALQWHRYLSGDSSVTSQLSLTLSSDAESVFVARGKYLLRFGASDGSLVWQRSLTGPAEAIAGYRMAHAAGFLYIPSTLASMPSTGFDALVAKLPDDGSGLGTYGGVIVYSESALTSVAGSPTTATPTFTSTTATHTEAAGDMTDAAGTLTVTPYLP